MKDELGGMNDEEVDFARDFACRQMNHLFFFFTSLLLPVYFDAAQHKFVLNSHFQGRCFCGCVETG